MFENAVDLARRYTYPYAGLRRRADGAVSSTVAAFMVINDEGWCVTAKHVFDDITAARKADAITAQVEIWAAGDDWTNRHSHATDVHLHAASDIALFRLEPFAPIAGQAYPVLRTDEIAPGLSVCRVGFPFHSVDAAFADGTFDVKSGFPAPMFALEGIVSRFFIEERPDGAKATYIQTSSPGLRGQSGGPLFDTAGRLCGIQSSTTHLDLGFDATYQRDGQPVVERQFLNVGQVAHVSDLAAFLEAHGVAFARG